MELKKVIIEYLENTIISKKNMTRRIYKLEEELREAHKNEKYAIEQMNKQKEISRKLRRKLNIKGVK